MTDNERWFIGAAILMLVMACLSSGLSEGYALGCFTSATILAAMSISERGNWPWT